MALSLEDTAYILTYRADGGPNRRDNLVAVLRWLEQRSPLEVIVFKQDSARKARRSASGRMRKRADPH
jgi:hypothetical protein